MYPNYAEGMSLPFDPGRRILDVRKAQKSLKGDDRPPHMPKSRNTGTFPCLRDQAANGAKTRSWECIPLRRPVHDGSVLLNCKRDLPSSVREKRHMLEISQESTVLRLLVLALKRLKGSTVTSVQGSPKRWGNRAKGEMAIRRRRCAILCQWVLLRKSETVDEVSPGELAL